MVNDRLCVCDSSESFAADAPPLSFFPFEEKRYNAAPMATAAVKAKTAALEDDMVLECGISSFECNGYKQSLLFPFSFSVVAVVF